MNLSYDNRTYTFSCIYYAGLLSMYTIHPQQKTSPRSRLEYVMHLLRSFAMNDSAETSRQGSTCYRNARDLAKKHRDEAIRGANKGAVEFQARRLTTSVSFGQASSFAYKAWGLYKYMYNRSAQPSVSEVTDRRFQRIYASSRVWQFIRWARGGYWAQPSGRVKIQRESPHLQLTRRDASDYDYKLSRQSKLHSTEPSRLSQRFENQLSVRPCQWWFMYYKLTWIWNRLSQPTRKLDTGAVSY